jgi:hypothetical protein
MPLAISSGAVALSWSEATAMNAEEIRIAFRKPVRITITVPHSTHQALALRSDQEGRSLSNLAAYMIEHALRTP